ncbi:MAG: PASTA domain-containing protein, partial [Phycisphaerae bacterium]
MRKIVLLFFVAMFMAVPAMAAPSNVDITCTTEVIGDVNWVTVSYASDHNLIRAFGLDINVAPIEGVDGNIIDVCDINPNYRIYPGQISIVDGDVNDYYTAYDPCDLADHNGVITVEMGSLYTTDANYASDVNAGYNMIPAASGILLKFAFRNACVYTVDVNARRGGIVMEDPNEMPGLDNPLCSGSVCGGCTTTTVPDVTAMDKDEAIAAIEAANLVANPTEVNSCAEALNEVLNQGPVGGTTVACYSTVNFDYSLYQTTVPDVTNKTPDEAKALLLAANLTVDGNTCIASASGVGDGNVASTTPAALSVVACGTSVSKVIVECYCTMTDYTQWVNAGKPKCWCYPRQCKGDADGKAETKNNYWVANGDLAILKSGWQKVNGPVGNAACADFDHKVETKNNYRVSNGDLAILKSYWQKVNGPATGCTPGN